MRRICGMVATAGWCVMAAVAAEAPPKQELGVTAGVTLTDGNSETLKGNAGVLYTGERAPLGSLRAGADFNYGKSTVDEKKETDLNNGKAFFNARKTLTERTFAYGDTTYAYDRIAELDYRFTVGPGAGAYLVKSETAALSAEIGPAYVWEKVDGRTDNYWAVRIAERFEQSLSKTAKWWQALEYLPQASDLGNYLLNAELGIESAVNSRLSMRLSLKNTYDSEPGAGLEKNDLTVVGGVGIKLH